MVRFTKVYTLLNKYGSLKFSLQNLFEKEESVEPDPEYLAQIVGKDIIQLKSNTIPSGLVPLEEIFDSNDMSRSPMWLQVMLKWKSAI